MRNKMGITKKLLIFVGLLLVSVFLAACGIHYFEREAQPETFGSFLDAIRYTLLTLTTIGYVDAYPTTMGGQLLTAAVGIGGSLIGIACFIAIMFGSLTLMRKVRAIFN